MTIGGWRLLHRLGSEGCVLERVELPGKRRMIVLPELGHYLQRLVEAVGPFLVGIKWDAVGAMLELEPTGTDSEVQAPVAHVIDGGRHLRQHRRVAVGVAGHQRADAELRRLRGERAEQRPTFEAGTVGVRAEDGDEVIEHPGAVEAERLGVLPDRHQLVVGEVLRRGLDAEENFLRRRLLGRDGRGGKQGERNGDHRQLHPFLPLGTLHSRRMRARPTIHSILVMK
jgi:hypothetical protein